MKKQIIIFTLVCFSRVCSQVGINTTSPKGVLDIVSTTSAMVIPRLPNPQTIVAPVEGMLAYDSTNKTIRYYDGTAWSTLFYSQKQTKANEGAVKINAGGAGAGTKPNWANVPANTTKQVVFSLPLVYASSPTTSWPENSTIADSRIYNGNQFIENGVLGQVHLWRLIVNYTKSSNILSQDIRFILRNPLSGFRAEVSGVIPSSKTSGILVYSFNTIADGASLPAPLGTGNGYVLEWIGSDDITSLSIDSVTRISYHKD
ncbi:hypothetical protein SAMN05421664_0389 [Chryseobacterium soldanellicola]|uniref:Uncharacterized protein n=1 Tax=Chryseobacterium soldanellicola TaxID=311333 RepID=A0A1H0XZX3_9FLAO|nr:hypothetical protein [Chryseobacterium soldanellicola]SDQ08361.1 hypothetical protein SAMN05421664_0389 [Chryseobacterium soldanellicola]